MLKYRYTAIVVTREKKISDYSGVCVESCNTTSSSTAPLPSTMGPTGSKPGWAPPPGPRPGAPPQVPTRGAYDVTHQIVNSTLIKNITMKIGRLHLSKLDIFLDFLLMFGQTDLGGQFFPELGSMLRGFPFSIVET